jgi:hypothetical protein
MFGFLVIYFTNFVEFFPAVLNTDISAAVNHNKILLVSSIFATFFGRTGHPQAFKIHDFKTQK